MASDRIALEIGLAPVGTGNGQPITARRYQHPLLGDRPLVRLVGQSAAPGEHQALTKAGFTAGGDGHPVAVGRHGVPGYPDWVVLTDPATAQAALDAVPAMERAAALASRKPGQALDLYQRIAKTLPPHHLPVYWEQAGRAFLAAGRRRQAATTFGRARAADQTPHTADLARQRGVFLEFALAGALSVKDTKAHITALIQRDSPLAAHQGVRELVVRRTLGGLPPWLDMPTQLIALAEAAGLDPATELRRLLEALVETPALWQAADGFWTNHRTIWRSAISGSAALRRRLLWQLARLPRSDLDAMWITLLDQVGAFDELGEETADWLTAILPGYPAPDPLQGGAPQELLDLLPRLARHIPADHAPLPLAGTAEGRADAAVIAGCLAAGIRVADPDPGLLLGGWQDGERVALEALAADDRFFQCLWDSIVTDTGHGHQWREEWAFEPLRPFLRGIIWNWLAEAATSTGLPGALEALDRLKGALSREAVTHLPHLPGLLRDLDLVRPLTRTLRAGIFAELGWDAWDEAVRELGEEHWCRASWPMVTVYDRDKAIAVGPGGRIMEHRLKAPRNARHVHHRPVVFFSDGQFLVCHHIDGTQTHYWSGAPDKTFAVRPSIWDTVRHGQHRLGYTFLGPGARRFMGDRLLTAGDRWLAADDHMFHDGHTYWRRAPLGSALPLTPIHPASGTPGQPVFLDPSLLGTDEHWLFEQSSLAPVHPGTAESPLGAHGSLLGMRIARNHKTGLIRYHRIDGIEGSIEPPPGAGAPWGLLDIPGAERPLLLDGRSTVTARDPETGEPHWRIRMTADDLVATDPPLRLPPAFWHFLTPRDPRGSRALRAISTDTVRALLEAAAGSTAALPEAISALLPEVSHPLLLDGISTIVQQAAEGLAGRDRLLRQLDELALRPLRVNARHLGEALDGLLGRRVGEPTGVVSRIELASGFFAGTVDGAMAERKQNEHRSQYEWSELVGRIGGLALRAVSVVTVPEHREALTALLSFWAGSPLADPGLRRGLASRYPRVQSAPNGRLLPLGIDVVHPDPPGETPSAWVFLHRGSLSRPDDCLAVRPVGQGWATAERLRTLLDELTRRGPVPYDPKAAGQLAGATGLGIAEAALLLTGLPGMGQGHQNELPRRTRATLGLPGRTINDTYRLWRLPPAAHRLALYDAAMPEDPAQLWDQPAMAERLAQTWRRMVPGN